MCVAWETNPSIECSNRRTKVERNFNQSSKSGMIVIYGKIMKTSR